jgi:drug/metabolite transporter (DMT)-like permease
MPPRLVLYLSLAAVYVIWGSTYYAMRVAVEGLPPMLMGAMRFIAAGAILLGIAVWRGAPRPTWRQILETVPVGILFFIGGNAFVAIAETRIDSGVAAVVCATMPLWAAVIASATGERPSLREWLGLAIGFGGVVVLVGGAWKGGDPLYFVLLVLSPLSWAAGSMRSRKLRGPGGVAGSAMQMTTGGIALLLVALVRGERIPANAPTDAWIAVAYLMVFGSLVAFSAYGWLLRNARPAVATSYAYVNPAVAVVLGAIVGGEVLGLTTILATALIVAAVALVVMRPRTVPPRVEERVAAEPARTSAAAG